MNIISSILRSPVLNLIGGLILLVTSGHEIFEVVDGLSKVVMDPKIRASHGVFIYSIIHMLRVIPELLDSAEYLNISSKKNI